MCCCRQLVDKNVCWQRLCNEKDTQISELRRRLKPIDCLLAHANDQTSCQHRCTCSNADVRIYYSLYSMSVTWLVLLRIHVSSDSLSAVLLMIG